jgi:hypothetical protein
MRTVTPRSLWIAAAVSALLHAAPAVGPRLVSLLETRGAAAPKPNPAAQADGQPAAPRSPEQIAAARRSLVQRALEAMKQNRLRLGAFVLAADALDAEEARVGLDTRHARQLFLERCALLRRELSNEPNVSAAVTRAFSDYAYSMAVNRMSDMLVNEVGACGPTTQLIAACLYDMNQREGLALRYWGGVNPSGATHITPTWTAAGQETDLTTGQVVAPGGAKLQPDQMVEAYARAHGILPPLARGDGAGLDVDAAASEAFQYPPNRDVFESGEVPLFSERRSGLGAAQPRAARGDRAGFQDLSWAIVDPELLSSLSFGAVAADGAQRVECVLSPRALTQRSVQLTTQAGSADVELMPVISPRGLSVMARAIARYEVSAVRKTEIDRLTFESCRSLSYTWAAPRFAAAGFDVIARESAGRAETSRDKAVALHRRLQRHGPAKLGALLKRHPDHWTLVAFEAGEATLLGMDRSARNGQGQGPLSADELGAMVNGQQRTHALLSKEKTRSALIAASDHFDLDRRMEFLGIFASYRLVHPDIDLPKTGWLPGALYAYDGMLRAMGAGNFGTDGYFDASLDVLRAAGATPQEIEQRKQLQRDLQKRLGRGRMGKP